MNKIAIFVEGQTEQIFVRELIHQVLGYQSVRVIKEKIRGKNIFIRIQDNQDDVDFSHLFHIVNVGSDERVSSAVLENSSNMVSKGFRKIIGLRDLFPNKREEEEKIRILIQKERSRSPYWERLAIHLAVMEIEAWFIADFNLFKNIDSRLTSEFIKQELGLDLVDQDPEIVYDHPAGIIQKIFYLVGRKYRKREKDSYKIVNGIDFDFLYFDVRERGRINCFFSFVDEIEETVNIADLEKETPRIG